MDNTRNKQKMVMDARFRLNDWRTLLDGKVLAGVALWMGICILSAVTIDNREYVHEPSADKRDYLLMGFHLYRHRIASDAIEEKPEVPTYRRMPLYPFVLAVAMRTIPEFEKITLDELLSNSRIGNLARYKLRRVNILLHMATISLVFLFCTIAFKSIGAAAVASSLVAFSIQLTDMATGFFNENLTIPLFFLFVVLLVVAYAKRLWRWYCLVGVVLGLLTLTRVVHFYLWPLVIVLCVLGSIRPLSLAPKFQVVQTVLAFGLCFMIVTVPWVIRNHSIEGQAVLSARYGTMLAMRAAINDISVPQYFALFVVWNEDARKAKALSQRIYGWLGLQESDIKPLKAGSDESMVRQAKASPVGYLSEANADSRTIDPMREQERAKSEALRTILSTNPLTHLGLSLALVYKGSLVERGYNLRAAPWAYVKIRGRTLCSTVLMLSLLIALIHALRRCNTYMVIFLLPSIYLMIVMALAVYVIPRYFWPMIPVAATSVAYLYAQRKRFQGKASNSSMPG